jgi:hypothetical protein
LITTKNPELLIHTHTEGEVQPYGIFSRLLILIILKFINCSINQVQ